MITPGDRDGSVSVTTTRGPAPPRAGLSPPDARAKMTAPTREGDMARDGFSWLHLTDLHYGLRGQKALWPNVRGAFMDDLARLHDRCGPWDAVLFTGDLVQMGRSEEFRDLQKQMLGPLWAHLETLGSGDAKLLAVPGNHDLYRPDTGDNPAAEWLIEDFDRVATRFWDKPAGSYRRVVDEAFAAYTKWWKDCPQRPTNLVEGALPGDFALTIERGDRRIGVMGLNAAFLQLAGGDYHGKLTWSHRQVHALCPDGVDRWRAAHDVCLLLTHHGPDWLTDDAQAEGKTEIAPPGRFALHLFGHMHSTDITYERRGGSTKATRRLQGISLFGMERYGDPPTLHRAHGYSAGRVRFDGPAPTLRIWPRLATSKTGGWRLIPDQEHAVLEDDEGTAPEALAPMPRRASPKPSPMVSKPPPATKPAGPRSNLPGRRPFFGRVKALEKLAGWLHPTDRSWGVLLDGPGGMGKTALALEAAHRAPVEHFPLKLWITAKTRRLAADGERKINESRPEDLQAIFAELAELLGREDLRRRPTAEVPAALRKALAERRALLVLDNLETLRTPERRELLRWLDALPADCRAIVTSRRRDQDLAGHAYRVDKLEKEAARALLSDLSARSEDMPSLTTADQDRLYAETGGNPLLLHWTAAQLGRLRGRARTVDEAVERLRNAHHDAEGTARNDPLHYVFGDLVESFTADELVVLAALSHFTGPAPLAWIVPLTTLSPTAAQTALDDLRDRALLVEDDAAGTWALPPLAARYLKRVRPGAVAETGERLAARAYALVVENGYRQYDSYPALEAAWPQVEAAMPLVLVGDNRRAQAMCNALAFFMDHSGRWRARTTWWRLAEARAEAAGDALNAGWQAYRTGFAHSRLGEAEAALACGLRAEVHWLSAEAGEQAQAVARHLQGVAHRAAGDHEEALEALEWALASYRKRAQESGPVAIALTDIAVAHHAMGQLEKAEAFERQALRIKEAREDRVGQATSLANLAECSADRARWADAEALARQALPHAEATHERDGIAHACTQLARALAGQGRGAEGIGHARRAVEIYSALSSPELPRAEAVLAACTAPPDTLD